MADRMLVRSTMSPLIKLILDIISISFKSFGCCPSERLCNNPTTSFPVSTSRLARCDPTKPVMPVINTRLVVIIVWMLLHIESNKNYNPVAEIARYHSIVFADHSRTSLNLQRRVASTVINSKKALHVFCRCNHLLEPCCDA